tara:strand:+ start:1284 stop:2060 length:777 start_codon:yes stop_codon:yes gene_type:complete
MVKENLGILLSLCSKNQNWTNVGDLDLFKVFIPSFYNTISNKYNYKFFIGYDDDDKFIIDNLDKIKKRLRNVSTITELKGCKGNPCNAWNILLKENVNNADYFYQVGTDIHLITKNWDDYFIRLLKKNNNLGICSSTEMVFWNERLCNNQNGIAENILFHKTHYNIFKTLFNPKFKNWFSDDYISQLYYSIDKCFICGFVNFRNTHRVWQQKLNRYEPDVSIQHEWKDLVNEDKKKLFNYVITHDKKKLKNYFENKKV